MCGPRLAELGLRVVVLAAFALGSTGGECLPLFVRLDYEKGCERAAIVANKTYVPSLTTEEYPGYPAGCYWHAVDGSVYFNAKGAIATVNPFARQICAGASIPALQNAPHATEHGIRHGLHGICSRRFLREMCHAFSSACLPASEHLCLQTIPAQPRRGGGGARPPPPADDTR